MVRAVNELFSVAHVPFRRHMSRKKKRRPEQQIRILCEGGICFKTRRRRVFFVKKINNGEITETQYMRVQFQNIFYSCILVILLAPRSAGHFDRKYETQQGASI
eukprot:GEMP01102613.1.p1 GENE.GEMP01102613.1~~GEMP01102613.1.p1  ORF type:complete len:104 (+),score=10.33 GEMP01102613.1:283-594(+)